MEHTLAFPWVQVRDGQIELFRNRFLKVGRYVPIHLGNNTCIDSEKSKLIRPRHHGDMRNTVLYLDETSFHAL